MHRKNLFATLLLAASVAVAAPVVAQEGSQPITLTAHPLRGGVYWIEGGAANTGFIVGDKGVVVFDAQMTPEAARKALAEIAKATPKPVDAIVISHADPDHVCGLPAYPAGLAIIAQENTKSEILASAADPNGGPVFGPLYRTLSGFLPTRTIASTETAVLDGVHMELMYTGPAHTSGDLFVYLPAQKIVFAGDIITTNTHFPVVHLGGTSLGWITAMKTMLALDADIYVPGHGPIQTKAMLRDRLREAEQRREQIKAMVSENKTLEAVEQALPDPGTGPMPFATFTQTIFGELTKGYPPVSPPWANLIHK